MIQLFPDKLSVRDPNGADYGIFWADVFRVHVGRLDLKTETALVFGFDFEFGDFIEVTEGMEGFEEMVTRLGDFLPLPANYKQQIHLAQCDADPIVLYSRP